MLCCSFHTLCSNHFMWPFMDSYVPSVTVIYLHLWWTFLSQILLALRAIQRRQSPWVSVSLWDSQPRKRTHMAGTSSVLSSSRWIHFQRVRRMWTRTHDENFLSFQIAFLIFEKIQSLSEEGRASASWSFLALHSAWPPRTQTATEAATLWGLEETSE